MLSCNSFDSKFMRMFMYNFLLKSLCSEKDMRLKHVRYVKQLRYVQNISLAKIKLLWKHWHTKQTAYSYKYFLLKVDGIWNVAFPYFFVLLFFFLNLSISYNEEYKKKKKNFPLKISLVYTNKSVNS